MSRRYSGRRWLPNPTGELYGCKARLRELTAERRAVATHLIDLEGAHAALVAEVNTLRATVRIVEASRAGLVAELGTARSITRLQARIISDQGDELVRAVEALGVVLHTPPGDLAWAHRLITGVIRGEGTER